MMSMKKSKMAELTDTGSLRMGSEKVWMIAETADYNIQPKLSEKVRTMAEGQRLGADHSLMQRLRQ